MSVQTNLQLPSPQEPISDPRSGIINRNWFYAFTQFSQKVLTGLVRSGSVVVGHAAIWASDGSLADGGVLASGITQLTGPVTAGPGSGSQATTITNAAVTLAKIANAAANSKLLGSGASGSGASYTELALGSGLTMTGTTLSASGGSGTVTNTGTLAANQVVIGNGGVDLKVLGSLGTTTTLLHGNAAGAPSFSAVDLAADVTGNLAVSHLNSGTSASSSTFWRGDGTWAANSGSGAGELIGAQIITTTGAYTYTPTGGTNSVIIELQGAGGGGSGVAAPGGGNSAVGAGGGAGGWLRVRLTANFSGATGSVGAKGAGGAAGNNAGATGGNTTFVSTTPTTYTAGGGAGGGFTTGGPAQVVGPSLGGTCTNGDENRSGNPSIFGACFPGPFFGVSGQGGSSPYAGGGAAAYVAANPGSTAGVNADGKGGGGSGAVANGATTNRAGGDGSDGLVIIWEFT